MEWCLSIPGVTRAEPPGRRKGSFSLLPSWLPVLHSFAPSETHFVCFLGEKWYKWSPAPCFSLSLSLFFFFFLSLIQDRKSFHQKNRCHLLWSFVVVLFYFIKKIFFSHRGGSFKHNEGATRVLSQRWLRFSLTQGRETKQGDVLSVGSPPQGPSSCISDANGRQGCGGGGEGKGPGSWRAGVEDSRQPGNNRLWKHRALRRRGLRALAWRAQVAPQLHWTFIFRAINGPCIENMRAGKWLVRRKETLWEGREPQAWSLCLGWAHDWNPRTGMK